MSNETQASSPLAHAAQATGPASVDPWSGLKIYLDHSAVPPDVDKIETKPFEPCFLFRGQENWLSRLRTTGDPQETAESVRQELRALSARWLKMQNVCVLLGAGASKNITGFVASGLFSHVKALLAKRPSAVTFDALLKCAKNPDAIGKRFEEFLSQLAIITRLQDANAWPLDSLALGPILHGFPDEGDCKKRLADLLVDIERAIAIACNVTLPASALGGDSSATPTAHEVFLAKLVARDPQFGRARIFTTNYDTLVEQAMDRIGILYSDGFSGTVTRRFNPAAYDLDLHYPGDVTEGRVRRYDKVLLLYKLHGSINWMRSNASVQNPFGIGFRVKPLPSPAQVLGVANPNTLFEEVADGLAILPTAAKYGESLAMPFAHLFRSMGQALTAPQTVLFIVGYSGWDRHVNQLIQDALTNPGFTCVLVDPQPSEWARRLCAADYCGRVYCLGGEWGTFECFARHILPDLEMQKTELAVARTLRELRTVSGPPEATPSQ